MRAHELIFEARNPQNYRSQKKTWQDLEQALPRIQTAIDLFQKGVTFYRGLAYSDSSVLFKPQMPKGTRISANSSNYYTLFIDNNAKWKDYPPRSASIVATTSMGKTTFFGTRYILFPEGDPLIGVTGRSDFWESFPRLSQIGILSLDSLNYLISNIIHYWLNKPKYRPTSWNGLKKELQRIDQLNYLSFPNLPNKSLKGVDQRLLELNPGTTMEEKLDYLLDPQANGIDLTRLSTFKYDNRQSREIWFSAPCWLINYYPMPTNRSKNFDLVSWIKQKAAEERR